ncbi:hypothetical protein ACQY0O_000126 [Thecaphora frezii]
MMAHASAPALPSWPPLGHGKGSQSPQVSCSIKVLNLPQDATESWIRMLFCPIGRVVSVERRDEDGCAIATVRFATAQQADSAFRFNGYMANGKCLHILPASGPAEAISVAPSLGTNSSPGGIEPPQPLLRPRPTTASNRPRVTEPAPTHKNLYILNLPLDVTTDQLAGLFGRYGTVIHCVILAMLDAQARRRGFIDMSMPTEAKDAIEGLNGFVWHGYPIEVSYAIVQRSGGPFDHATAGRNVIKRNVPRNRFNTGPRRVPSDSSLPTTPGATIGADFNGARSGFAPSPCPSSPGFSDGSGSSVDFQGADPRAIFISGLNPEIVMSDEGLARTVEHLGDVLRVAISRDEFGIVRGSGTIVFSNEEEAHRAVASLHGKVVDGRRISAHRLNAYGSSLDGFPDLGGWANGLERGLYGYPELQATGLPMHNLPERPTYQPGSTPIPSPWQRTSASALTPSEFSHDLAARPFQQVHASSPIPLSYFTPEAKLNSGAYRHVGRGGFRMGAMDGGRADADWPSAFLPFGPGQVAPSSQRSPLDSPQDGAVLSQPTYGVRNPALDSLLPPYRGGALNLDLDRKAAIRTRDGAIGWDLGSSLDLNPGDLQGVCGPIWTPPRQEAKKSEDSPDSGRSISSTESGASLIKTPELFDRITSFAPSDNHWHMGPLGFSNSYNPHPSTGRSSRGDELREGSLPVLPCAVPDTVVGTVGKGPKRKSLPPVGHEKVSSPPRSQNEKAGDNDIDSFHLDLGSLRLGN